MKAIMIMFDSLNRRMLPPYGCDWVHAPNFQRLAKHAVTFENAYVASMPCMPARRELHTGRINFLHRSWGSLEPFDDSMPELLKNNGISTHLISDHYHYWEDGGATYHNRYSSWQAIRGQEGDPCHPDLRPIPIPEHIGGRKTVWGIQDWINRSYQRREQDLPQAQTFARGLEFLHTNAAQDNWFLQVETFDPHEPFHVPQHYQGLYPSDDQGPQFDWPPYAPVSETPGQVRQCRHKYAALVSMCDHYLGQVLDAMDALDLWKDTLLIVNTDHGFLLGEHDWWGKCVQPFYNEIAHMPLFIWDPRCACQGERRSALVQTIDLPATLLEFFGVSLPADMQGVPLRETVANDHPVRPAGLFGLFGGHVNITDGRYVYMRAPVTPNNTPLFNYTLMPTQMHSMFPVETLQQAELAPPFSFTKQCPLLKIPGQGWRANVVYQTMLFDVHTDPYQQHPLQDDAVEKRMIAHLVQLMKENDAPADQFERLGLV